MTRMDFARAFAKTDYLTVGTRRTIDIAIDALRSTLPVGGGKIVVDVAGGKGVAGCDIATAIGTTVVIFEIYPALLADAGARLSRLELSDRVAVVAADGNRLPLADGAVAAATCVGGASIVGIPRVFEELARVVRRGGLVVVSDVVWRTRPDGPLGEDWGDPPAEIQYALPEYQEVMRAAGLRPETTEQHPRSDWEDYVAPILEVAREARAAGDTAFADELQASFELELRWAEAYWDYVTIVARVAD
jgi:ubiquinone/menaquinone biosynthesis C-methylase UbiE